MSDPEYEKLKKRVERQASRIKRAEKEHEPLISHTLYIGTIGLLFIVPIILGAYVGQWLDEKVAGYSVHWTTSLIFLGIIIGVVNVYLYIREGSSGG